MDNSRYKKALQSERDVLYKRARRLGSAELLMQYRTKRSELKELMLSSRQAHLRNELASTSEGAHLAYIEEGGAND